MTLPLELGGITDPYVRRALEQLAQQFPITVTGGGGGGAPSGPASGDLGGSYPGPTVVKAQAGFTIGGVAAVLTSDSRLSDARTPTAHATTHQPGGSDAMAVDAAAATGSLRTLGTGATQAAAGNDSRLSDARTPTAHQATHQAGGTDALSGNLNAIARSNVMKTGVTTGTRRAINFIEGTNVTITQVDDAANEKVDVTITAAAGASASALAGAYTPITYAGAAFGAAVAAATYVLWGAHTVRAENTQGSLGGVQTATAAFYIDPADWTVSGLTTKLRVRGGVHVGATAPATTLTIGLYPVSAFTNTSIGTAGTVVTGSTVAFASPAANTHTKTDTADFNVPTAGWYFFGCVLAGATAASSSTTIVASLHRRWV